jgi:hypothetical protein
VEEEGPAGAGVMVGRGWRVGEEMRIGEERRVGVVPRVVRGGRRRGQAGRRRETMMRACWGGVAGRDGPLIGEGCVGDGRGEERRWRRRRKRGEAAI